MSGQKPPGHRLIVDWRTRLLPSTPAHQYGGLPANGAALPQCPGCGGRHHLLFQIDLADPSLTYLELAGLDYLFVFSCLNCATYERPMYYTLPNRGREIVVLRESPGVCVREYPDPLDKHRVSCRALRDDEYPLTEDAHHTRSLSQEGKHQLGGMPVWVQGKEHIPCLNCGKAMVYLAMVDSELYVGQDGFREQGHMFGDEGILYVWVCRACGMFAARAQGL